LSEFYQVSQTAGPCLSTVGASDDDDGVDVCVHLVDSEVQCRQQAGPASAHDGDL